MTSVIADIMDLGKNSEFTGVGKQHRGQKCRNPNRGYDSG